MTVLPVIRILAALQVAGTPATVSIASDSPCPSDDAIRAHLQALGGMQPPRSASVMVRNRDDHLVIEFGWPDDAQPQSREVTAAPDCESRAQAAAVVIASWLGILPEASLQSLPLGIPFVETRYVELSLPTTAGELGAPNSPPPAASVPIQNVRAQTRSWPGVGLGTTVGGGVVPGFRAEFSRERTETGVAWSWLTSAFVSWPRTQTRGGGTSVYLGLERGVAATATARFCLLAILDRASRHRLAASAVAATDGAANGQSGFRFSAVLGGTIDARLEFGGI